MKKIYRLNISIYSGKSEILFFNYVPTIDQVRALVKDEFSEVLNLIDSLKTQKVKVAGVPVADIWFNEHLSYHEKEEDNRTKWLKLIKQESKSHPFHIAKWHFGDNWETVLDLSIMDVESLRNTFANNGVDVFIEYLENLFD